jgi:uncharacterized protein YndB with AHSA1/START domain
MPGFIARADIDVDASPDKVWHTITANASDVNFGAVVESDWRPGSSITWKGEWEGKAFEDTGEVVDAVAPYRLVVTHSSPGGDAEHVITYELSGSGDGTRVELSQDGNASDGAASESAANWRKHLEAVKDRAER